MWSPWIANRARQVVPLTRAAADRGVQVTVFLRPDDDRNMGTEWAQRRLPELYGSGAVLIRSDHEHRKLVIIDDERVLIGSANVLSNTPETTREVMIVMEGRAFAERMRSELRVDEIGRPRACPGCGRTM
jgi:phosphatidylserine/phosphatidylglycerophosphate/cardiolipin synthase-like enzyme